MELTEDADVEGHNPHEPERPRRLQHAPREPAPTAPNRPGGGPTDAAEIVNALKSSADQELTIAERLASKARQAFALGAGFFVVAQTVAFGNFDASKITTHDQHWIIGMAIAAVLVLGLAAVATLRADSTVASGDLPLSKLEDDLNAAYDGDPDVLGRLGGYYLGVVRSRRSANAKRRSAYKFARLAVVCSLTATVAELVLALVARTA